MRGFVPPRYRRQVTHTRGLATALGFAFGVDDSTVCRASRRVEPLLAGVFRIPERKVELSHDEIRELFFDATERPTNRPGRGQRAFDSGKKRHAIERQVVVVRKKKKKPGRGRKPRRLRVACVSRSFAGSTHDKRVYDRAGVEAPEGVPACGDTAHLGTGMETPAHKPEGKELTARQKRGNRRGSRRRIVVEHGIGTMKIWRIAADGYRNPRRRHTLMFKNVAGLHDRMFAE